jgi:hypothetical protein
MQLIVVSVSVACLIPCSYASLRKIVPACCGLQLTFLLLLYSVPCLLQPMLALNVAMLSEGIVRYAILVLCCNCMPLVHIHVYAL